LADEVGVPKANVTSSIFASKATHGTQCHFDRNENFTVQVRGTKIWKIAPNAQVENPTANWLTGRRIAKELRWYFAGSFPESLPTDATRCDLEPGAQLYVPRGYCHATIAEQDSVSINFAVLPFSWADLVEPALRALIIRDSAWRAGAQAAFDGSRQPEAATRLSHMLQALAEQLVRPELVEDILRTAGHEEPGGNRPHRFRRNELARLGFDTPGVASVTVLKRFEEKEFKLELGPDTVKACQWIMKSTVSFSALDVCAQVKDMSVDEADALLESLLSIQLVVPDKERPSR
jgi:hypothetical protein